MSHYISGMPYWGILLFIASFLFSVAFIANFVKRATLKAGAAPNTARNIQIGIFIFYLVYLTYVSVLSLNGVFLANAIPPKVVVWASLPLAIILFGFVGNTKLFNRLLRAVTLESLIQIHIFRLVGVFFLMLYSYHLLPRTFALSGGWGDIIAAVLAFPVARLVSKGSKWAVPAVYAWNIFGILDIVRLLFIATVTARATAVTGVDGGLREITMFPFVWFPAFAPATIFFLHALVFRKIMLQKASQKTVTVTG